MDLMTTRPKTRDRRRKSQAADYADYDFQTIDEEEETFIEAVEGDPLEFVTNNNQLPLDGVKDTEINYDDNDVEIMSSSPPKKNSTRGQRSKCAECDQMISTTNLSRHIKRNHCPGGKSFKSAKSSRTQNKTKVGQGQVRVLWKRPCRKLPCQAHPGGSSEQTVPVVWPHVLLQKQPY